MSKEIQYALLIFGLFIIPRALQRFRLPSAITSVGLGALLSIGFHLFHDDSTINPLATLGIVSMFLFCRARGEPPRAVREPPNPRPARGNPARRARRRLLCGLRDLRARSARGAALRARAADPVHGFHPRLAARIRSVQGRKVLGEIQSHRLGAGRPECSVRDHPERGPRDPRRLRTRAGRHGAVPAALVSHLRATHRPVRTEDGVHVSHHPRPALCVRDARAGCLLPRGCVRGGRDRRASAGRTPRTQLRTPAWPGSTRAFAASRWPPAWRAEPSSAS